MVPLKEEVGQFVASVRLKAGVASVSPGFIVIPPRDMFGVANLVVSIEPASCALVIVPVKEDVGQFVPEVKSNAGVAYVPPKLIVIPPKDIDELVNLSFAIEPAN